MRIPRPPGRRARRPSQGSIRIYANTAWLTFRLPYGTDPQAVGLERARKLAGDVVASSPGPMTVGEPSVSTRGAYGSTTVEVRLPLQPPPGVLLPPQFGITGWRASPPAP